MPAVACTYRTYPSEVCTEPYYEVVQALVLLEAMWEAGPHLLPDTVSYNAAIKACGAAGQVPTAMQVSIAPPATHASRHILTLKCTVSNPGRDCPCGLARRCLLTSVL